MLTHAFMLLVLQFDDGFGRRRLQTIFPSMSLWMKQALDLDADSCTCSDDKPVGVNLTASVFQTAFSSKIDKLEEEGELSSELVFDLGSSAIQAREEECGRNVSEFHSIVASGLLVDINALKSEDIHELEQSFSRAYNKLTFLNCDTHRRTSK